MRWTSLQEISVEDSFNELAKKVLNTNINALMETYSLIREEKMDQAIRMLYEARRIFFYGVGASMLTAMKAMNKFLRIENKVVCIQDSHMQAMAAATMTHSIFLFRCNKGYDSCSPCGKKGRSKDYLYYKVCEISVKLLCRCYLIIGGE